MANKELNPRKRSRFESTIHILKEFWWLWLLIIIAGLVFKLLYLVVAGAVFLIVCGLLFFIIKIALMHDDERRESEQDSDG